MSLFPFPSLAVVACTLLVLLCAGCVALYYRYWFVPRSMRHIPYIQPAFLLGNAGAMGLTSGASIAEGLLALHTRLGRPPIHQLWLGRHHFLVLHSPQLIQALFSNHKLFLGATPFLDSLTYALFPGGSINNFDGEMHRRLISVIAPLLRRRRLEVWLPLVQRKVDLMMQLWDRRAACADAGTDSGAAAAAAASSDPAPPKGRLEGYAQLESDYQKVIVDVLGSVVLGSDLRSIDEALLAQHAAMTRRMQQKGGSSSTKAVSPLPADLADLSSKDRRFAAELLSSIDRINDAFAYVLRTALHPWLSALWLRLHLPYQRARKRIEDRVHSLFEISIKMQAKQEDLNEWAAAAAAAAAEAQTQKDGSAGKDEPEKTNGESSVAVPATPAVAPAPAPDSSSASLSAAAAYGLSPHFRDTFVFAFGKAVERGLVSRALALNNLFGLTSAASEATIATASWTSLFLSKHPQVQARIREEMEQQGLMPSAAAASSVESLPEITSAHLDSLVYLDATLKESLRLGFSTAGSFRVAAEDTKGLGVRVKRGQQIMWAATCVQRDAAQWTGDPFVFAPERFLQPTGSAADSASSASSADGTAGAAASVAGSDVHHNPYAWLPFGGGVHGCPGRHLGWMLVKATLVRMMQHGVHFSDHAENTGGHDPRVSIFPKKMRPTVEWTQRHQQQ